MRHGSVRLARAGVEELGVEQEWCIADVGKRYELCCNLSPQNPCTHGFDFGLRWVALADLCVFLTHLQHIWYR